MRYSEKRWLIIIAGLWVLLIGPGKIEGGLFPAAEPMRLIVAFPTRQEKPAPGRAMREPGGENTAFWLSSGRPRPECAFRREEWFLGKRGGKSVPVRTELGPAILRPDGAFTAGPWVAHVPVSQFADTFADVLHQCRWFGFEMPWLVRTPFWN